MSNTDLIFSTEDKDALQLLDISVKSIKKMIEKINEVKNIQNIDEATAEAKILASEVEKLFEKYTK